MLHGDVPEGDKKTAEALRKMEIDMEEQATLSPQYTAQAFVCLAHDWYEMGSEEEGHRLLKKADIVCPEYFRKHMQSHTLENSAFELLVNRLFAMLGWQLLDSLKDKNNV